MFFKEYMLYCNHQIRCGDIMKKLISLFSVIILLSSLCACGAKSDTELSNADHIPSLPQTSDTQSSESASIPDTSSSKFQSSSSAKNSYSSKKSPASSSSQSTPTKPSKVNPKTDLVYDKEISGNFRPFEDELLASGISFHNDEANGLHCVLLSHSFTDNYGLLDSPDPASVRKVTYQNTTYYHYGAGQTPCHIELTDTEIIVKNAFWDDDTSKITLKLVMLDANNLKVTYSIDSDYPVGTVLSTNWQSTIK